MQDKTHFVPFITLLACVIVGVVGYRYVSYVSERQFTMHVFAPCDPATEQCFASECSPEEDPGCPLGPYKKIDIIAADAPECLEEHTCTAFSCVASSCATTYCAEDTLEDGESCTS